jgi:tRNA(fMet)-specific endonuclease VapC
LKYLLDTNAVITLLNNQNPVLAARVRRHRVDEIGLSSVVDFELFFGAYKSQRAQQNCATVENLRFEVVDFDKEDAREAGEVRAFLGPRGTPIGPYDVMIAGQARCRDLVLVTHNTRKLGRVPHLQLEDWTG